MQQEIERKFLVKQMPDFTGISPIHYERYFLQLGGQIEERIQKKGGYFEREKKVTTSPLEATKTKEIISEEEFNILKDRAVSSLIRESYLLPTNEHVSIKIYKGTYEGLVRAEVEFNTSEEAKAFMPFDWMGKEITETSLGKDSKLVGLTRVEFEQLLQSIQNHGN